MIGSAKIATLTGYSISAVRGVPAKFCHISRSKVQMSMTCHCHCRLCVFHIAILFLFNPRPAGGGRLNAPPPQVFRG